MRILAIDYGEARTGVAYSDEDAIIAMPLTVIHEKVMKKLLGKIADIVKEMQIGEVIVGNPINMNATRGLKSELCEAFAEKLRERFSSVGLGKIPVTMWDERLSTAHAYAVLNLKASRGKKHRENVDAVAASLILESYLGYLKNKM